MSLVQNDDMIQQLSANASHPAFGKSVLPRTAEGCANRRDVKIFNRSQNFMGELGVAVESNSWNGLLAPAGTPDAVVQRLNAEVNRALASPPVVDAFSKSGITSLAGTPQQFAQFLQSEVARYAQVIRQSRITLDT